MIEILEDVIELLAAGREFALVTLVADQGSTPRAAGAEMLVRDDGSIAGTIGGGLLEHSMMRAAAQALGERRSRILRTELSGTDLSSSERMVCGGAADALIACVPPGASELREACAAVREAQAAAGRGWFVTVIPAEDGGPVEHGFLDDKGAVTGARSCDPAALRTATDATAVDGTATLPDGRGVVIEPVGPPATALICGAGHVARALVPIVLSVGFRAVVIDDREEFAVAARFPGAKVLHLPFSGALAQAGADERSYVVIVTRGHAHDFDVLQQALRSPARYIGLMASRRKRARFDAGLRDAGFGDGDIARVHSPIGVAIGAEPPAELAISIVAEMVGVRAAAGA